MNTKSFIQVAGPVFSLVALVHLLRVVFGWEAVIGGWEVPVWASVVAVILAGYLGFSAYQLMKK
ncbi:MAG: hypothetical protein WEA04_04020 [Candidatus Andersenbacteria bacterium]